ncbi:MAG: hypothetical protein N3B18_08880 [Desulfobacterota bacterium]|nr:hypothetical protein [Thermodesulfobacteriota bacterium]
MELRLLRSRSIVLGRQGIPLDYAHSLVRHGTYHDANLHGGYGSDQVLEEIRRMENALGRLGEEHIRLRIAADFCCIWRYDFPQRIFDICALIGGRPAHGLRLHYQISPQRRDSIIAYAEALAGWLQDKSLAEYDETIKPIAHRIYTYLQDRHPLKDMLVKRTLLGLSLRALNCSFWGYESFAEKTPMQPFHAMPIDHTTMQRMAQLERDIKREMGAVAEDFLCDVGGSAEPACHFKFIRRIDILISSIGCFVWRGNLPPKDNEVSGRRELTRTYLDILEHYWNGKSQPFDQTYSTQYNEIFELLGPPNDLKRWLVACLWKNIFDQTTYHVYPMRQWVEFVHIGERYLDKLEAGRQ